jgi:RHS repeat-associated protein
LKKNYLETMCKGLKMSQEIRLGYYAHGPLAKIELGQHSVETQNFAYTLQGWIKGVQGENFSYALGYNSQDYTSIGNSNGILPTPVAKNLFNGNIATMATDIPKFGSLGEGSRFDQAFSYDQLNRLKSSQQLTGEGYKTSYMYDPSGNIEALTRNDKQGNALDRLSYNYENKESEYKYNTNKLRSVDDATITAANSADLEDQGIANYQYDDIGNLLKDDQEDIQEIKWTVYGKVQAVTRKAGSSKPSLAFSYDASGNRVAKKVINTDGTIKTTFYVRDASGNTMAVYEKESSGALPILSEQHIYGSQRLGMIKPSLASLQAGRHVTGIRSYELSDHLGNVSVVLSDYKLSSSSTLSATSYYPFGMMARSYQFNEQRYGFGGKERVDELRGGDYDFGDRYYDARIARWLSLDKMHKKYPSVSSYVYALNSPLLCVDPNGQEVFVYVQVGNVAYKIPVLMTINDKGHVSDIRLDYNNAVQISYGVTTKENKINKDEIKPKHLTAITDEFTFTSKLLTTLSETEVGEELVKAMNVHPTDIEIHPTDEANNSSSSHMDKGSFKTLGIDGLPLEMPIFPDIYEEDFNTDKGKEDILFMVYVEFSHFETKDQIEMKGPELKNYSANPADSRFKSSYQDRINKATQKTIQFRLDKGMKVDDSIFDRIKKINTQIPTEKGKIEISPETQKIYDDAVKSQAATK